MAYPQPNANDYAKLDYGFFRLNTPLTSPGDIYESPQTGHAFAIGPDSDIANAVAVYLDEQADGTTRMDQVAFSSSRAMVGEVLARLDQTYGPSGRKGRLFFYCNDIFDPNFRPKNFNSEDDAIEIVTPVLDIIEYFKPIESLGPARVDRRYYFQDFEVLAPGTQWLVLPFYGRRYASITFQNANATDSCSVSVSGLNYAICDDSLPTASNFHQEVEILPLHALAPAGGQVTAVVRAGSHGMWDALILTTTTSPTVIRATFSDIDGST